MIENSITQSQQSQVTITKPKTVLRMVKNERMGGSVPIWTKSANPLKNSEDRLTAALTGRLPEPSKTPDSALAYNADPKETPTEKKEQEFSFGDLVDMVNPLHHIPVVSKIYRNITGDNIKPVAQVVGGSLYGGPVGAASSLVNVIVEKETGKDLTENAMALLTGGRESGFKTVRHNELENPEKRLNRIVSQLENHGTLQDLPGALLSFTNLSDNKHYQTTRTKGQDKHAYHTDPNTTNTRPTLAHRPMTRTPITELSLSPIPGNIQNRINA